MQNARTKVIVQIIAKSFEIVAIISKSNIGKEELSVPRLTKARLLP